MGKRKAERAIATREELKAKVKNDICEAIDRFFDDFDGTTRENKVPTINQIEDLFGTLDGEARDIFLDMTSSAIDSIDEGELIESKKENTQREE